LGLNDFPETVHELMGIDVTVEGANLGTPLLLKTFNKITFLDINFLAKAVMLQNKNKMVKELESADMALTILAAPEGSEAKSVKIRPIKLKSGAPGG
jgi:hypothetical protein